MKQPRPLLQGGVMEKSNLLRVSRHEDFTFYRRGKIWYYKCYDRDGILSCGYSTGCKSRTAAQRFCEELRRQGVIFSQSNRSFKTYAEHFFDDESTYILYAKASGHEYSPVLHKETAIRHEAVSAPSLRRYVVAIHHAR